MSTIDVQLAEIQVRRGTSSEWSGVNPVLAAGEWGLETDTGLAKLGDGSTAWAALPHFPTYLTSDFGQDFKLIVFSNGTVKAIPASALPPAQPTGLAVTTLRLTFVVLGWTAAARADHYVVLRNGSSIGTTTGVSFTDSTVAISSTYSYTVQAIDAYGQPGPVSSSVSAFIDPALDQPPVTNVTIWPSPVLAGVPTFIRVAAYSKDALTLAYALGVNVGQITPTADPSEWRLIV